MYRTEEEKKEIDYLGVGMTLDEIHELKHTNPKEFKKKLVELANTVFAGDEQVRAITLRVLSKRSLNEG